MDLIRSWGFAKHEIYTNKPCAFCFFGYFTNQSQYHWVCSKNRGLPVYPKIAILIGIYWIHDDHGLFWAPETQQPSAAYVRFWAPDVVNAAEPPSSTLGFTGLGLKVASDPPVMARKDRDSSLDIIIKQQLIHIIYINIFQHTKIFHGINSTRMWDFPWVFPIFDDDDSI